MMMMNWWDMIWHGWHLRDSWGWGSGGIYLYIYQFATICVWQSSQGCWLLSGLNVIYIFHSKHIINHIKSKQLKSENLKISKIWKSQNPQISNLKIHKSQNIKHMTICKSKYLKFWNLKIWKSEILKISKSTNLKKLKILSSQNLKFSLRIIWTWIGHWLNLGICMGYI